MSDSAPPSCSGLRSVAPGVCPHCGTVASLYGHGLGGRLDVDLRCVACWKGCADIENARVVRVLVGWFVREGLFGNAAVPHVCIKCLSAVDAGGLDCEHRLREPTCAQIEVARMLASRELSEGDDS